MSSIPSKKVFLFTSDIASFIGQNAYDFVTPFERLWKRCDTECYNNIINNNKNELLENRVKIENFENQKVILQQDLDSKVITKRQYTLRFNKLEKSITELKVIAETLETKIDNIDLTQEQRLKKTIGEENVKLVQSATIETDDKRDNITNVIKNLDISDQKKKILLKESESFINKTHGTLKEDSAISIYERRFGVKLDTTQQFFKKQIQLKERSDFEWYIGGRVDGLYKDQDNNDNSYIIEVKNRTKGFFSSLRDYEKTQIHLYMYMLSIPVAKLVEKYKDQIRITVIHQDDDYLNDILTHLQIFVENFEGGFLRKLEAKTKFVACNQMEKQNFIRKLYLNAINDCVNKKLQSQLADDLDDDACLIDDDL
jgi:hypothetical protein